MQPRKTAISHLFTVDVEEYFQVSAFDDVVPTAHWSVLPSRIERSIDMLLELLAQHEVSATFFTLGWIAEQHPHVVRTIANAGHEIASHSYWHRRVLALTPKEFRADLRRSKSLLEDVTSRAVNGYRAPSFSIVPGTEWAFDVLVDEGFRYDSSLFPIRRPGYGYPGVPGDPHTVVRQSGSLWEFPPATLEVMGARLPAGGGGYLRHFPFGVVRSAFQSASRRGTPATFYIHPWELDADQPRIPASRLTTMRHYRGLALTRGRIERLLGEFAFTSIEHYLRTRPVAPTVIFDDEPVTPAR